RMSKDRNGFSTIILILALGITGMAAVLSGRYVGSAIQDSKRSAMEARRTSVLNSSLSILSRLIEAQILQSEFQNNASAAPRIRAEINRPQPVAGCIDPATSVGASTLGPASLRQWSLAQQNSRSVVSIRGCDPMARNWDGTCPASAEI